MAKLTIKNPYKEQRFFQRRLMNVTCIIIFLVICLVLRLFYLQVIEKSLYSTLSKENQLNLIPIEPKRGLIFDRNGVLLAENIPVFSLDIIPSKVKNLKKTISGLEKLITIHPQDLQAFYRELKQHRSFDPVPLIIKLTPTEVAEFSVNRWRFPGVTINARLIRFYPHGKSVVQVVGFMGRINAEELSQVNAENYSATNYIGKVGIEKYYENILHGTVGYQQVETDASGRVVRVMNEVPPVTGDDLYLTIDSKLEKVAENAFQHDSGAAIAIDPNTGEVLALVSKPNFNPNLFVNGISQQKYNQLQNAPNRPLYNRAIRGLYAPGSTIKPYYGLLGLSSGVINTKSKVYDPGYFKYAGHTYRNWEHTGFGWVDLEQSIILSDDPFFYKLAVKVGVYRMDALLHEFGFGQTTNIEMGEELPGVVPSPAWKKKHIGANWYTGDTINMGIGQGYLLVTPLQMAQAVATLSEHGIRYQPHLLLKMQAPDGTFIPQAPIPLQPIKMPKADWDFIIKAMTEVIKGPLGFRFGHAPYTVAAKTGTAQVYTIPSGSKYNLKDLPKKYQDNSVFIAFAPVEDPKIAVAIVVEHDEIAPAIARKIMDYYLLNHNQIPANTTTATTQQTTKINPSTTTNPPSTTNPIQNHETTN